MSKDVGLFIFAEVCLGGSGISLVLGPNWSIMSIVIMR